VINNAILAVLVVFVSLGTRAVAPGQHPDLLPPLPACQPSPGSQVRADPAMHRRHASRLVPEQTVLAQADEHVSQVNRSWDRSGRHYQPATASARRSGPPQPHEHAPAPPGPLLVTREEVYCRDGKATQDWNTQQGRSGTGCRAGQDPFSRRAKAINAGRDPHSNRPATGGQSGPC
jgi:hypothetical protein